MNAILIAILAAVVYSASHYLKKTATDPRQFDFIKFVSTVIIGAGIGFYMYYTNNPVTEENVVSQLAAMTGAVAIVENVLKWMYRAIRNVKMVEGS